MADNLLPPPEQLEEWAQRMPAVYAYLLLYLRAKAGQRDQEGLAISQASLAAAMDLTRDTVSRGIKRLSELGLIRLEADQHRTIIHVHKLAETSESVKETDNIAIASPATLADVALESAKQEERKGRVSFARPTVQEVTDYAISRGAPAFDAANFCDWYESKGWKIGKSPMKNWQAAVRTWLRTGPVPQFRPPPAPKEPEPNPEDIVDPKDIHDLVVKLAGGVRRMP
jgi:DNA-binding MarR family transcriptional regulator